MSRQPLREATARINAPLESHGFAERSEAKFEMPLLALHASLETELDAAMVLYEELGTSKSLTCAADFTSHDECVLEGILSRIWQSWCRFCREFFIESCMGSTTVGGTPIPALPHAFTAEAVSFAAIKAKQSKQPYWNGANSTLRHEPTWGDVDVLLGIATRLSPANASTLSSMCTMASPSAKIVQAIRNSASHFNHQSMAEVARLSSAYVTYPINHPSQALFWVESRSEE